MTDDRSGSPALYMLWDSRRVQRPAAMRSGYTLRAVSNADLDVARPVVELDGALTDRQWASFVDLVLPDGACVAVAPGGELVGTATAVHNPGGPRFYFPGGGAIAYLVVHEDHRRAGLGRALVDMAIARLRTAGYRTIWVAVEGHRLAAIRTYLAAGFVPFLHPPAPDDLADRWRVIFQELHHNVEEHTWPRDIRSLVE